MTDQTKAITPYTRFRELLRREDVAERFDALLKDRAPEYLSGLLTLVTANDKLLACDYSTILSAAAKAAILRLPIAQELGYAYIVPYGKTATFVVGYKGLVQLAIRTAQYTAINVADVFQGEKVREDRITGKLEIVGDRTGDEIVGYVGYFRLKNGFEKYLYMSHDDTMAHAKRYSKAYQWGMSNNKKDSPWFTHPHEMGRKTVLRRLLSKWGLFSIEMVDEDDDVLFIGGDPRVTTTNDIVVPSFDDLIESEVVDQMLISQDPEAVSTAPEYDDEDDDITRPYTPDQLKAYIRDLVDAYGTTKTDDRMRKVVASALDGIFGGDKTQRYELCKWLTGKASSKEMTPGYVLALAAWLEVLDFGQPPAEYAIYEARAALPEALKTAGQGQLL